MERDANGIIDNARNNLARLEHQRWVALHLVSGWTKLPKEYVTENVRQNEKSKQHACITTVEGLYDLQRAQTDPIIDKARKDNETDENIRKKENKALYGADTVCYDFDLMDRLLKTLDGSEFIIADDERHNSQ
jgi:hypothetical protein